MLQSLTPYLTRQLYNYSNHLPKPSNPSFYRRLLPSHLIALNSHQGKKMFEQSLREQNTQSFFTLVQQFITQNQPSTCASATMAMILNSLKIDPGQNWKGIWRWYDDFNLKSLNQKQLQAGLTLQEFHNIITLNNAKSMAFSPLTNQQQALRSELRQSSLNLFRNSVLACTRRSNLFLTVNFHRPTLAQTGIGHFSPIAAYNSKNDMALILDVAKFKYDSYWCSLQAIYQAFRPIDKASNQSRGFLINKKRYDNQKQPQSPLCFLELDFQFNRRLRQRSYYQLDNTKIFLINLLNDHQMHSLLIPILYQFFTLQIKEKEKLVYSLASQSVADEILPIFNNKLLNQQAIILLAAFTKQSRLSTVIFLYLVFTVKSEQGKEWCNAGRGEADIVRLVSKCQMYLGAGQPISTQQQ